MSTKCKVLISSGNLSESCFDKFLANITQINARHGPFDYCFLIGDVLGNNVTDDYIDKLLLNEVKIDLPVYFTAPRSNRLADILSKTSANTESAGQICSNLVYLGKSGIIEFSDGLRVGFLGATCSDVESSCSDVDCVTRLDCENFVKTAKKTSSVLDLLLSFDWPQGICSDNLSLGSSLISDVVSQVFPRYLIGTKERVFFERLPYENLENVMFCTRFIGLAEFGNTQQMRCFYAFNIEPLNSISPLSLAISPNDSTPNPFGIMSGRRDYEHDDGFSFYAKKKRKLDLPPDNYVCKICNKPGHFISQCPQKDIAKKVPRSGYLCKICKIPGHFIQDCPDKNRNERAVDSTKSCWFCLANPNVEKHLIVSISESVYLALPKGALVSNHVLLIPLEHIPSILRTQDSEVRNEIDRYKSCLVKYYASMGLVPVIYETFLPRAKHASLQIVPVSSDIIPALKDRLETVVAKEMGGERFVALSESTAVATNDAYVLFELPNQEPIILSTKQRLDAQLGRFPRRVLSELLKIPDRFDWKKCTKSPQMEKEDSNLFKQNFRDFDCFRA